MFARKEASAKKKASPAIPADDAHYGAGANLPAAINAVPSGQTEIVAAVRVTVPARYADRVAPMLQAAVDGCNDRVADTTFKLEMPNG